MDEERQQDSPSDRRQKGREQFVPTKVGPGATIGANATIVCGVTIGEYAFIGAGAVVTRDVPAYSLVVGNPARQIGYMCRCGERLDSFLACQCGLHFESSPAGLQPIGVHALAGRVG